MHSTAQNLDSRTEIDSTNQTRQPRLKNSDSRPQNLSYLGLGNPLQNRDSTTQTRDSRLETPEPTLENHDWRTLTRDPRMFWGLASVLESQFSSLGSRVSSLGFRVAVLGSRFSSPGPGVWTFGSPVRFSSRGSRVLFTVSDGLESGFRSQGSGVPSLGFRI